MSEKSSSSGGSSGCGLGCLGPAVGIAGLVATFALGPIDLGRSIYNQIVGDNQILKRQLVDYVRKDLIDKHPRESSLSIERMLGNELEYHFQYKGPESETIKVDPSEVSIVRLWDASEDHARSTYQQWVWPDLDK